MLVAFDRRRKFLHAELNKIDRFAGEDGGGALPGMVRPPPLPRPRTHQNHQRHTRGVEEKDSYRGYGRFKRRHA